MAARSGTSTTPPEARWAAQQKRKYAEFCDEAQDEFDAFYHDNIQWLRGFYDALTGLATNPVGDYTLQGLSGLAMARQPFPSRPHVKELFQPYTAAIVEPTVSSATLAKEFAPPLTPAAAHPKLDDLFRQCLNTVQKSARVSMVAPPGLLDDVHSIAKSPHTMISNLSPIRPTHSDAAVYPSGFSPLPALDGPAFEIPISRMSTAETMLDEPQAPAPMCHLDMDVDPLRKPTALSPTLPSPQQTCDRDSQWMSSTPIAAQPDASLVLEPHTATVATQGSVKRARLIALDPPACKFPSLASVAQSQGPGPHPHSDTAANSTIPTKPPAANSVTDSLSITAGEVTVGRLLASIDHVLATAQAPSISTTRPLAVAASRSPVVSAKVEASLSPSSQPLDAVASCAPPQFLSGTARLRKALEQLRPAPNPPPVTEHLDEGSNDQSDSTQEPSSTLEVPAGAPQARRTGKFATLPSLGADAPKFHMVKLVRSPTAPEASLVVAHLEDGTRTTASGNKPDAQTIVPVANQDQAPTATIPTEAATLVSLVNTAHPTVTSERTLPENDQLPTTQFKTQPIDTRFLPEPRPTDDAVPMAAKLPALVKSATIATIPTNDPFVVPKSNSPTVSESSAEFVTPTKASPADHPVVNNEPKSSAQGLRTPGTIANAFSAPFAGGSYIVQKLLSAMKMTPSGAPTASVSRLPVRKQVALPPPPPFALAQSQADAKARAPSAGLFSSANATATKPAHSTAGPAMAPNRVKSSTQSDLQTFRQKLSQAKAAIQRMDSTKNPTPYKRATTAKKPATTINPKRFGLAMKDILASHGHKHNDGAGGGMRTVFKSLNPKHHLAVKGSTSSREPAPAGAKVAPSEVVKPTETVPSRSTLSTAASLTSTASHLSTKTPLPAMTKSIATQLPKTAGHVAAKASESTTPVDTTPLADRAKDFTPTSFNQSKHAVIPEYQDVVVPIRPRDSHNGSNLSVNSEDDDSFVSSSSHPSSVHSAQLTADNRIPEASTVAPLPVASHAMAAPTHLVITPPQALPSKKVTTSSEFSTMLGPDGELPEIPDEYSDEEDEYYSQSSLGSAANSSATTLSSMHAALANGTIAAPHQYTKQGQKIPTWATSPAVRVALVNQSRVNPDAIFGKVKPIHVEEIFNKRDHRYRVRSSSANWSGIDKLTVAEEVEYEKKMGYD
ncbi:hypothetical protein H4R35_001342 [Dimargaris xerosporica]|nr:hypothetical protein H4R35_001342 [Dimargaris xerosporica]